MANTCNIAETLTAALSPIAKVWLSEAQSDTTPYAVYEMELSETKDKEGSKVFSADVTLMVVGKTFAEADNIATQMAAVMDATFGVSPYSIYMTLGTKQSFEGVWIVQMQDHIIQSR